LEWTIRVGVFEGMLYAVLQTLKSESRRQRQRTAQTGGIAEHEMADVEDICVLGVEPQRVAKYWAETTQLEEKEKKKEGKAGTTAIRRKQTTAKEGKKAKIDVIGSLLSGNGTNSSGAAELIRPSVRVGDNMLARQVASAFLDKWSRSATGRKRRPASSARSGKGTGQKLQGSEEQEDYAIDVGKLDDLADSLLQGVTWLAWRNMRLHFAAGNRPFDDAPQGRD
jgi:cruciform cutting endonuclease 1